MKLLTHGRVRPALLTLSLTLTVLAVFPASAQNLLTNGDAETGVLVPWSAQLTHAEVVASQLQSAGTVLPQACSFFFTMAGTPGASEVISQSGTSGLFAGASMTLSGFVSTEDLSGDDYGVATLVFLNSVGGVVGTTSTEQLTTSNNVWAPFELSATAPSTAASWRVDLAGTLEIGSFTNVFWDEVSLTASSPTPVPSVGGIGALLLVGG